MAFLQISPTVANPQLAKLGSVVYITTETRNAAGTLASAGTSTQIAIYRPDGSTEQAFTAMTEDATGKFSFKFASATSDYPGKYSVEIKTTDSSDVTIERADFLFELYNNQ